MENLKVALQTFNPNFIKEFMFWLREDTYFEQYYRIEYQLCPYVHKFYKFKDKIFKNSK